MKTLDISRFAARRLARPGRLSARQRGVTMIEYALIAALIAVVLVVILTALGVELGVTFTTIKNALSTANTGG
jgi:pilus assembly protein Flp/PilA